MTFDPKTKRKKTIMPTAYSYIRFSSKKQEKGDSIRRQTDLRDEFMLRHPKYTLDKTLKLTDMGKSAFRRKNMDTGCLGEFLQLVREGTIQEGSILLMENLDRFSRADPWDVIEVFRDLVRSGIDVVLLGNGEQVIKRSNMKNMEVFLPTVIGMQLAHAESEKKSQRLKAVWERKRKEAVSNGTRMTTRCPAWLKWNKNAKLFEVKPDAVKAVEYIFQRTLEGIGQMVLVKEMNETFPGIGRSKKWNQTAIRNILTSRAVLGEGQCYRMTEEGKRVKDGPAIPNYYPRIISDSLFYRVQACTASRFVSRCGKRGPDSTFVNLFRGVMVSADGHPVRLDCSIPKNKPPRRRLTSAGHLEGIPPVGKGRRKPHTCPLSVTYVPVERMIMMALVEIKTSDMEAPMMNSQDVIQCRREELVAINQRLSQLQEALTDPASSFPEIAAALGELRARRETIQQEMEKEQMNSATAGASPLKEIRSVVKHIESKPPGEQYNLRLKLRNLIASVVDRIELLPRKIGDSSNDRVTAEIIIRPKAGGVRLIADALGISPPTLDTPEDVVAAFGNRISEEDVLGTVVIVGGQPKPRRIEYQRPAKPTKPRNLRWKSSVRKKGGAKRK